MGGDSVEETNTLNLAGSSGGDNLRRPSRSKSLTNISPDDYSANDIRRIKERLMRTNSRLEGSTLKSFTRKQKMTLVTLALVDFISFCSMSIMAPFFPSEAAEKGLSDTTSGFIFSFYALIMFLTSPVFGKILPKCGAKLLFLSGMFLAGVCNILFGFLEYVDNYTLFTTLCIVIRGFEALGASAFSTASYVFVVNAFPQNIGAVLGILETFVGLGMSCGPALGGVLYSLGGFSMPFFVLGVVMILFIPLNICLLPKVEERTFSTKPPSLFSLLKVPTVVITGFVVIVVSSSWAFLDPTLEPHLRQFNLSAEKIGLIFLLFSALYGISSPAWGWLADKVNHHWSMMVVGLMMCTVGLLLLGPCPFIPFLKPSLTNDLVALSILGVSVALALLPTFQTLITSAVDSGCAESLSTYSIIAGVWSSVYSLGEVLGPSLGGFLLEHEGFPIASTIMALMTFVVGVVTFFFFVWKNNHCSACQKDSDSGSWRSDSSEHTPLLFTETDTNGNGHRAYMEEKVDYYGQSRDHDTEYGQIDSNQMTDIRGTVSITSKGACEV